MNLDAYRQQLRNRIDSMAAQTAMPTLQGESSQQPPLAAQPTPTIDGQQPVANVAASQPAAKPMNAQPDFQPEFTEDLDGAKSFPDVIKAMKPKSRNQYMDWWEGQYGSINSKWDALQSELGQRPDPKGKLSRKEKFELLMEFGLELMRASQPGQDTGGGATTAAYNAVRNTQAERKSDRRDWDVRNQLLQQARTKDLTAIGSRGQAMSAQSKMDTDETARIKNMAIANRPPKKQTLSTDQGVMDISGDQPQRMTIDGKPLTNFKTGSRGGHVPDSRPAEQKKYEHLLGIGTPPEIARRIAYRQSTGDPRKDYNNAFNAMVRATNGDTDAAKQAAQDLVDMEYGAGAIDAARTPDINKPAGPPKITSQADYDALKSGTEYVAPNGKTYRKK